MSSKRWTTRAVFFFFSSRRRHTRSLRDWSSDVCSSDLNGKQDPVRRDLKRVAALVSELDALPGERQGLAQVGTGHEDAAERSEERRVGKECRSRWSRDE